MAIISNTVRLKAEFKTFADQYADPTNITLKIYDPRRKQVGSTIDITTDYKVSTGIYQYDYAIPNGYTSLVYEFSGVLEGNVITGRSAIECTWT